MITRVPENPIRKLREARHLTQKDLAELAGVTPQRVLREEQFIYASPSEAILTALSENELGQKRLSNDYCIARAQLHLDFREDLVTSPFYEEYVGHCVDHAIDYWDALSELRSPTRLFREQLFEQYGLPPSAVKFSMYTGMHPGTLSDIETGKTDWKGASALIRVLEDSLNVPERHIEQLGILHDQYFMRLVRREVRGNG